MKRFFILASAAIVALASCAKTEVVYKDAPEQIAFKQITNVMTKGEQTALTGNMGVFAYKAGEVYLPNTLFALAGEVWGNENAKWPYNGNLDFIVYAPFNEDAETTTALLTLPGVAAADALYYGVKKYADVEKGPNPVNVELNHLSAKISVDFTAPGTGYTLSTVVLNDVCTEGNVTVDYSESPAVVTTTVSTTETDHTFVPGTPLYVLPGAQTFFTVTFVQENGDKDFTYSKEVSLEGATWDAHKGYTYKFSITPTGAITFKAVVNPWDDQALVTESLDAAPRFE